MEKKKSDGNKIKTGISEFLMAHGCPTEYLGFSILCDLLKAALENYADLTLNLKSIYLTVADQRKITRLSMERNLHTLVTKWSVDPKFKELFATEPTNAQLINLLACKLRYLNCSVYDTLLMP